MLTIRSATRAAALLACILLAACASKKARGISQAAKPVPRTNAPPAELTIPGGGGGAHKLVAGSEIAGRIFSINAPGRYVVISFPVGIMPPVGSTLDVFHEGAKCGEVKIAGPQRDTFIIADILQGGIQPGDEARAKARQPQP